MSKLKRAVIFAIIFCSCPYLLFAQDNKSRFTAVYAKVLTEGVNIRAGQGLNFEVLGQLNKGDEVIVAGQQYDWYRIKLPKDAHCFVHQAYIKEDKVTANKLRVRAGSGLNFNCVGTIEKGDNVEILQKDGDWLKIVPPDNCTGWVQKGYLQLTKRTPQPETANTAIAQDKEIKPEAILPQERQNTVKVTGVVDDLGKIYQRKGTHKLLNDKITTFYLTSDSIDLNHYVYRNVSLIGQRKDSSDSEYPVIDVQEIKLVQ